MNLNNYIKEIQSKKPHPIIFICGLGGSGKTTFAEKLVAEFKNAKMFSLDWYALNTSQYRREKIKELIDSKDLELTEKELNPQNWYDWDKFESDLKELQTLGKLNIVNAWNQNTGEKDLNINLDFKNEHGIIVCEGIYLLHPEITQIADGIILLEVSKEEARIRADKRDAFRSNREHLDRKAQLMERYDIPYIEKYRKNASLIIT